MSTPLRNTQERYGIISMSFHWIMALIIIGLLIVGLYMTDLPTGPEKIKLYGLHKATGITILFLVVLRLLWRMVSRAPHLQMLPAWERIAAQSVQVVFYGLMIAMPITGWFMSSAAEIPVSFFGLFILPSPLEANETLRDIFRETHHILAYCFIVALVLHIAAALKHQFIDKDTILTRMLP